MLFLEVQYTLPVDGKRLTNVCFFSHFLNRWGKGRSGEGFLVGKKVATAEKPCPEPAVLETFLISPQNCQELPDVPWSAADLASEHGGETHQEEMLHGGRHVPGARGCLGGRVPEHAGGPQLPARGQCQLSGGGGHRFSQRVVILNRGAGLPPTPEGIRWPPETFLGCYSPGWAGGVGRWPLTRIIQRPCRTLYNAYRQPPPRMIWPQMSILSRLKEISFSVLYLPLLIALLPWVFFFKLFTINVELIGTLDIPKHWGPWFHLTFCLQADRQGTMTPTLRLTQLREPFF